MGYCGLMLVLINMRRVWIGSCDESNNSCSSLEGANGGDGSG